MPVSERDNPIAQPPGSLNLLLATAQICAAFGIFFGLSRSSSGWHVAVLAVAFIIVGNAIYFMLHEAEHRALHPNRWINDIAGTILAMFFPAPFALLRRSHLAHHYYNRTINEAFDLYLPDDPRWWKRLQFYGLLTGAFYVVTVLGGPFLSLMPARLLRRVVRFDRQTSAFIGLLDARTLWWIRIQTVGFVMLHTAIVWTLTIPWQTYAMIYLAFGVSWSTMQYLHHYGTPLDRRNGAIDLRPLPLLSWIWLHHHLHLTHHRHPRASWTRLPELARQEGIESGSMWRQYLRQWRGPTLLTTDQSRNAADRPGQRDKEYALNPS